MASLGFAILYAGLYQGAKRNQALPLISQSYFSLMLIFLVLIPPILLPEQWSVLGWALEGLLIFSYALWIKSSISRYLAIGLLIVAGLSSLYYWVELPYFPCQMYWGLCVSYFAVVLISNSRADFREQLSPATVSFNALQMLCATSLLFILLLDHLDHAQKLTLSLLMVCGTYLLMNELMLACKASSSWLFAKWLGLVPIFVFALILVIDQTQQGIILWPTIGGAHRKRMGEFRRVNKPSDGQFNPATEYAVY